MMLTKTSVTSASNHRILTKFFHIKKLNFTSSPQFMTEVG